MPWRFSSGMLGVDCLGDFGAVCSFGPRTVGAALGLGVAGALCSPGGGESAVSSIGTICGCGCS